MLALAGWEWFRPGPVSPPVASCQPDARPLSAHALRAQVIRNQLHLLLQSNVAFREMGSPRRVLLIRGDVNRESLEKMVVNHTLPAWLETADLILTSTQQIDALPDDLFDPPHVIVNHDINGRKVGAIPTHAIQRIPVPALFAFTPEEQSRRYGKYAFSTTQFWFVSLVCCDGKGPYQGLDEAWHFSDTLRNLKFETNRFFAASACGDILVRSYGDDDDSTYVFNR